MKTNRTMASGERLTLITTIGGRPVSRQAADNWCRKQTSTTRRKAS